MEVNLYRVKKIHFIGIGGIGVSALAKFFISSGKQVSGSDVVRSEITEEMEARGVKVFIGHKESNLPDDAHLVVYSPAVEESNPERQKAKKLGISELSYPEALGLVMEDKYGIVVSGTNGKSTVTALIGLILTKAGFDPTVIVGSKVKIFEGNFRMGKSKYFVVEGCEWKRHFLNFKPKILVITNIEEDHLDYYKDLEDIRSAFNEFAAKVPEDGLLVLNADDPYTKDLVKAAKSKVLTYSILERADLEVKHVRTKRKKQIFDIVWKGSDLGEFIIQIPAKYNIYNAIAAATVLLEMGVDAGLIKDELEKYLGIWRRFEVVGMLNNAVIISDYAHQHSAVQGTIKGARRFYPQRRIMAVFQPHHRNRTKMLFDKFVQALANADIIVLNEIFNVVGREKEEDDDISSRDLTDKLKSMGKKAFFGKNLDETKKIILENIQENDVVLIMGAGDIDKIARELVGEK